MITKNKDIKKALDSYFTLLSSYQPVYSTYAGGIYEMELTRAAIHCFATHCSKLKPEVVGNAAPALGRVLQYQPNPIMDTKKYLYRLATCYMTDNNTLIAPLTEFDEVKGFYPLAVGKAQLVDHGGQTYVRYDMGGGEYFAVELARCGILNQFQYTSELWGESNLCLRPTLELLDAQNQGIINGIKNSAVIRFIAKLANSFKPKDVKEEQERLKEINLGISNTAGVFLIDQKYEDVKQIDSKPYIINPSQMEYIKQNVFTYFGTNEHILQNKFTPDEWNAYYEGKIEPFALELGLVHTNMTFSEREKSFGNQIFFSSNRLQYASISDKINYVVQMGDRGRTSINEDREVFNLPPIEDGDRHFIRGEYRPVDSYEGTELSNEPLPNVNETLPDGSTEPVDKSGMGGIIELRENKDPDYIQDPDTGKMEGSRPSGDSKGTSFDPIPADKVVNTLRKDSGNWIKGLDSEQIHSLKKYTKNSGDKDDDKFYIRMNSMLRGDIPEDKGLRDHAERISSALKNNKLKHDIICYRSTDHNPVEGLKPGDTYEPKQFLSSSVTKKGALKKGKYQMVIRTPKGSCGAYIEGLSKYPKQREYLHDYKCKYRLVQVKGKKSVVEVLPDD